MTPSGNFDATLSGRPQRLTKGDGGKDGVGSALAMVYLSFPKPLPALRQVSN
jgi:hypothetical protein